MKITSIILFLLLCSSCVVPIAEMQKQRADLSETRRLLIESERARRDAEVKAEEEKLRAIEWEIEAYIQKELRSKNSQ